METHSQLTDYLEQEPERWKQVKHLAGPDFQFPDYLWGVCIARTRAFAHADPQFGPFNLIAMGDLFNHDIGANIGYQASGDGLQMHYYAYRDIGAGEELLVSYGCHSRLDLLRTYGFYTDKSQSPACDSVFVNRSWEVFINDTEPIGTLYVKHHEEGGTPVTTAQIVHALKESLARFPTGIEKVSSSPPVSREVSSLVAWTKERMRLMIAVGEAQMLLRSEL